MDACGQLTQTVSSSSKQNRTHVRAEQQHDSIYICFGHYYSFISVAYLSLKLFFKSESHIQGNFRNCAETQLRLSGQMTPIVVVVVVVVSVNTSEKKKSYSPILTLPLTPLLFPSPSIPSLIQRHCSALTLRMGGR
jgi:hypothetical protein